MKLYIETGKFKHWIEKNHAPAEQNNSIKANPELQKITEQYEKFDEKNMSAINKQEALYTPQLFSSLQ